MKKLSLIIAAILVFGVANVVKADDDGTATHNVSVTVPKFAIIDIESSGADNSILLEPNISGLEAGSEVDFSSMTNSELWLNYTAVTDQVGGGSSPLNTNKITVVLNKTISGLDINLTVDTDAGNGEGTVGNLESASAITLSDTEQKIVGGIGSCYTGNGSGNGHNLTYSVDADEYGLLLSGTEDITVTYTITAE